MSKEQVFSTLWHRMAERGDFPTLQQSVTNIVTAMQDDDANAARLVAVVLSDFALTQKVIRLANSAMYASFGGEVTTVSRALMVLGVETVGHLALGSQLLDNFAGLASHQAEARDEMQHTLLAGEFARKLTLDKGLREGEEAVVCTLMHRIARLLVVFYFPEEWQTFLHLTQEQSLSDNHACLKVLGVTFEDLAEEAARKWGLPAAITHSMKPRPLDPTTPLTSHADWLSALANLSCQVVHQLSVKGHRLDMGGYCRTYSEWLALDKQVFDHAGAEVIRLKTRMDKENAAAAPVRSSVQVGKPDNALHRLTQGLAALHRDTAGQPVSTVTPMVLETLMQSLGFHRCFALLLNPKRNHFEARLGFGSDVAATMPRLQFEAGFVPDVFHLVQTQHTAIYLRDTHQASVAPRIPVWYREALPDVTSFMLIPVHLKARCVALLYGDWGAPPCPPGVSADELEVAYRIGALISDGFACVARPATLESA